MKTYEFWHEKLQNYIGDYYIDDLTDLDDSTCLTYFIGTDGCHFKIGSEALGAYVEAGKAAHYVKLQLSVKADILCIRFFKYEGSLTEPEISAEPFTEEGKAVYRAILAFAFENQVKVKRYGILLKTMVGEESAYSAYFEPEVE